mmetsp:Transcript_4590/g.29089  ORF Transcript_4590/g.29089 Transcript_4590/m.29089 type:complete len:605 (-) Transcript_4590:1191-3005(-)
MWPTVSAWSCALAVATIAAFANAAGTGGGPLFVPLLGILLKIDTRDAAALSQSLVFFGSVASTIMHAYRKHPLHPDRPCLDAGLVLALQPMLMAGVGYGVVFNSVAPNELVCTSLMLVLVLVAATTMRKGLRMWQKEGREGRTVQYSTYIGSASGLFAGENRCIQSEAKIELPASPRADTPLLTNGPAAYNTTSPAPIESHRCRLEEACVVPAESTEDDLLGENEMKRGNLNNHKSFYYGCGLITAASWTSFLLIAILRAALKHNCGALYWCSLLFDLPVAMLWEKVALRWVNSSSGVGLTLLNEAQDPNLSAADNSCNSGGISQRSIMSMVQVYSAADLSSKDNSTSEANIGDGTGKHTGCASIPEESKSRLVSMCFYHDPDADPGEASTRVSIQPLRDEEKLEISSEQCKRYLPVDARTSLVSEEQHGHLNLREHEGPESLQGSSGPISTSRSEVSNLQRKKQKGMGLLPLWALLGGVAAGGLGFGGSVVVGPLLLSLNVHPQVTAAVCSAIVFCSSSLATVQYWLADRIALTQAVGYGLAAMGGSTLGVFWISVAIRQTGRASITVLLLSALIGVSAVVVLVFKFIPAVRKGDMHFHPLCQ